MRGNALDEGGGDPLAEMAAEAQDWAPLIKLVPDLEVALEDKGRMIGDRGSNIRAMTEGIRVALGHIRKQGKPPHIHFVQNDVGGELVLNAELTLYHPYNNAEHFELASLALKDAVEEIKANTPPPETRHCFRPEHLQREDWECPGEQCGNLNFKKRTHCQQCGLKRPPKRLQKLPDPAEVLTTVERLGPPKEGESSVTWLVPKGEKGKVIGKEGSIIRDMKESSGAQVILSDRYESRTVDGVDYSAVFIRGSADACRAALEEVRWRAEGGRLGGEEFVPFLNAMHLALRGSGPQGLPLRELARDPDVKAAMDQVRPSMDAAGMKGVEVLEQWPDRFDVQRSGREGAMVRLAGFAEGEL